MRLPIIDVLMNEYGKSISEAEKIVERNRALETHAQEMNESLREEISELRLEKAKLERKLEQSAVIDKSELEHNKVFRVGDYLDTSYHLQVVEVIGENNE